MTEAGTRISRPEDFRNLAVYERSEASGPVYSIVFSNPELEGGFWYSIFKPVGLIAGLFLVSIGALFGGRIAHDFGLPWYVGTGASAALGIYLIWFFKPPAMVASRIELDIGRDRLRVLRLGRLELERPFSSLKNLTVEDHPDTESERETRRQLGKRGPGFCEKQHCLFGWFGAGGSEQVELVTRLEWPKRNSLVQVREAILWAGDRAAGRVIASAAGTPPEPQTGSGIKPPLD